MSIFAPRRLCLSCNSIFQTKKKLTQFNPPDSPISRRIIIVPRPVRPGTKPMVTVVDRQGKECGLRLKARICLHAYRSVRVQQSTTKSRRASLFSMKEERDRLVPRQSPVIDQDRAGPMCPLGPTRGCHNYGPCRSIRVFWTTLVLPRAFGSINTRPKLGGTRDEGGVTNV